MNEFSVDEKMAVHLGMEQLYSIYGAYIYGYIAII